MLFFVIVYIKAVVTLTLAAALFVLNEVLFFAMISNPYLIVVFVATLSITIAWGRRAVRPAIRELEKAARAGAGAAVNAALGIFLYSLFLCQRYVLALAQQSLHPLAFALGEGFIDPAILLAVLLYLALMFQKAASEEDEDERRP